MRVFARAQLLWELAWARALIRIAMFSSAGELTPQSQLYLADLHFRLADEYERARRWVTARRHRKLANEYAKQGPPPPERPAAAMAMPIPQPPIYTDARYDPPPNDYDSA